VSRAASAAALAPLLVPLALGSCARQPERPNVLLITVDTLRADRLGCLGYPRETTPALDRLAAEALVFTRVESPRAKTTPALASLMSGLYPHEHGVRDLTTPLGPDVPVLAEALRRAGWATGALVGNWVLRDELSGLARGFDLWVEDLPDAFGVPPEQVPQRSARSLTDGALAALGLGPPGPAGAGPARPLAREGEPWFLWLHYMDPHGAYEPPAEERVFRSAAPDPVPAHPRPVPGELHAPFLALYNVPPEARLSEELVDAARVRDLYDAEVRYADREIGRLLDALRASGALERTLVIVTADHGESLGEHRYWFEHGRHAYEVTCRVPLIVRVPERLPPGLARRPEPARRGADLSLADLAPTLLELLRLPPLPAPPGRQGPRGLARAALLARDAPPGRAVFCEKVDRTERSGAVQAKGVRMGDWKLLRRYARFVEPGAEGRDEIVILSEELYDLAADPYETANLAPAPPPHAPLEELREELERFTAADTGLGDLGRTLQERRDELGRKDRETLRVLEALGY
jgi:arylsulfatase